MLQNDRSPRRRLRDNLLRGAICVAAATTVLLLVSLIGYIFMRGLPYISWELRCV